MEEIKKNYIVICDKEEKLQLCEIFTKKGWKVCSDFNSKKPKRPFSCWFEVKTRQIWQEEYFSAEEITAKEFISRFGPEEESDGFKVGDQFKNKRTREIIELTDVTNLNDISSKTIKGSMDCYLWSRNYLMDNFEKIAETQPKTAAEVIMTEPTDDSEPISLGADWGKMLSETMGEMWTASLSGLNPDTTDDFEDLSAPDLFEKGLEEFDRGVEGKGDDSAWYLTSSTGMTKVMMEKYGTS